MTIDTTSLRERAIAAFHARRAEIDQREAARVAALRAREREQRLAQLARFQAKLDAIGLEVTPTRMAVEVAGVTLTSRDGNGNALDALAPCRECGFQGAARFTVCSLADLGEVLDEWLPTKADRVCDDCRYRADLAIREREDLEREEAWERGAAEREEQRIQRDSERAATRAEAPPATIEERLLTVLREFVRAEAPQ